MQVLNRKIKIILLLAVVLIVPAGCDYNKFDPYKPEEQEQLLRNADIANLKALYEPGGKTVYDDIVIAGVVTANDKSGNFYRSLIIEDYSAAIEIKAGLDELHNTFPIGRYVAVKAKGLRLGCYNEVIEIGLKPDDGSFYETDYFGHKAVMDMYVVPGRTEGVPAPLERAISDLDESMCGRLVKINGLRLVSDSEEDETWAVPRDASGNPPKTGFKSFEDRDGQTITVVTSGYANFAGATIPVGRMTLTGILSYGNTGVNGKTFILKLRDIRDAAQP